MSTVIKPMLGTKTTPIIMDRRVANAGIVWSFLVYGAVLLV